MGHNKWVNGEKMHILELINHESNDFKQIGSLIISRWSCHADFHNSLALFSNKNKSEILGQRLGPRNFTGKYNVVSHRGEKRLMKVHFEDGYRCTSRNHNIIVQTIE